jgi:putative sigma-54 modulation protein
LTVKVGSLQSELQIASRFLWTRPESPGLERIVRKESASVQIAITCRHGSISDELRDTMARKSEKLLTYFERVTAIGVTVIFANEQVNGRIRVEILLDAEHKHNFVATDDGDEVLSTFDRALSKMEQQVKKYKAKIQDHRRGARLSDAVEENPTAEPE